MTPNPLGSVRTRVKICGLTRIEDVQAAARLGADALGLVFHPPSPRAVTPAQAVLLARAVPPFVTLVGLFVNASRDRIAEVLTQVPIALLQFHGDETPADCVGHGRPWIKALPMRPDLDVGALHAAYREAGAAGLLLDAYRPGLPGGTGERFDWARIPPDLARTIILAGGLTPDNVAQAVRQVRPYAVDVSGGVEQAPGLKDPARMGAFIRAAREADPPLGDCP